MKHTPENIVRRGKMVRGQSEKLQTELKHLVKTYTKYIDDQVRLRRAPVA